jgi:hypothetical protein
MGAGFFGGLLNDIIAPGINRMTGGSNLGTIGANVLKDNMPGMFDQPQKTFLTPQEQVQQSPGQLTPPSSAPLGQLQQPPQFNPNPNPTSNMGGGMPQQDNQQYYQQMRESMQGMDKALKELEGIQTPGGKYNTVGGMGQGSAGK